MYSYVDKGQPFAALGVVSTQKNNMVLAYIMISSAPSCKSAVTTCCDSRDVWLILKSLFPPVSETSFDS